MAGASLGFTTQGHRVVEQRLHALAAQFGDLSPLMDIFGLYLESSTIERFDTETAPDGSKWTPSIRARDQGGKTLTDKGLLKASQTYRAGSDEVEWGSNLIYAAPHNFGATIRPLNGEFLSFALPGGLGFRRVREVVLPQREFLGINDEDETELLALAGDYAIDAVPEIER